MAKTLRERYREAIGYGLHRSSLTSCSRWAEETIMMGKPIPGKFGFKYHPWLRDMHDSSARRNVGKKAAQVGYSVMLMNRSLYLIDVRKESVLYLMPTKTPGATDFSANRFNPLLEMSPYLQNLFSEVNQVGSKRAGSAVLYIRGANSKPDLRSIPTGNIMFDELDVMLRQTSLWLVNGRRGSLKNRNG
ncbi:MAG: hypothetical protein HC888_07440 [Candidatus Competibacteraceae bacterium]|nr:hypothetical protein [Candidatus Competibacteraceae bacterium]